MRENNGGEIREHVEKRLKRASSIWSCNSSPRSTSLAQHCDFSWYEADIWTEIAKYLDGKCLVMLGSTNRWFHRLIMEEENIWKFACLRDMEVPEPPPISFKWSKLYASAFVESSQLFWQQAALLEYTSPLLLGTMQTLDARHVELFLCEEFRNGTWEYKEIACHDIKKHTEGATGGIFDLKHIKDRCTSGKIASQLNNSSN
ncbi:hypothetical protein Scep_025592 [Stephania cephalantha]|uniref:F-box protein n=1 Tax=Stephania cephalantha TaxID=152367 RepID=A0AAP0HMG0_9MAGN